MADFRSAGIEEAQGLPAKSPAIYEVLEKKGRLRLEEAAERSPSKRKACYRNVARWFKGTPLAAEAKAALEAMK